MPTISDITATAEGRPAVTGPQKISLVLGGVPIVAVLLRAFGVYELNAEQVAALDNAVQWGAVLAGLLLGSDAVIRTARNQADAKVQAAAVAPPTVVAPALATGGVIPSAAAPIGDPEDPEAAAVPDGDLPSDDEELAAPPVDEEPDEPAVVQPSQGTGP